MEPFGHDHEETTAIELTSAGPCLNCRLLAESREPPGADGESTREGDDDERQTALAIRSIVKRERARILLESRHQFFAYVGIEDFHTADDHRLVSWFAPRL